MANLQQLRDKVRSQTETTVNELPDVTLDSYIQEAYNRTVAAESQWPFFEATWQVNQAAGDVTLPEPPDCGEIVSLVDTTSSFRMELLGYEQAEDMFLGSYASVGAPRAFSRWNGELVLWPPISYDEIHVYHLRGFRTPSDWMAGGASAEPDCDSRLHLALAHYATALAYAQQEDMELEKNYMDRWQRDVEIVHRTLMEPDFHRPLIMGRRYTTPIGPYHSYPPFVINVAP